MTHKRTWTAVWAVVVAASIAAILAPRNRNASAEPKAQTGARVVAPSSVPAAASEMAKAGLAFYNSLEPEKQKKAGFGLDDAERLNWHFVPKARKGLPLKEMSEKQRELALAFLRTGLSEKGFATATGIMQLDTILKEIEKGSGPTRDAELYYFTLFGTPGAEATWGWRVEGHHLSINILIADGKAVAASPTFWGTNPHEIRTGPRTGERLLAAEEDLGRTLVKSLNETQRKKAIFDATAPKDIITAAEKRVKPLSPDGIPFTELTSEQQQTLTQLVNHYAHRLRAELAEQDLRKIQGAGWDKVHFAWAGGIEKNQGHYYRVQGPTFLIEYDNTQNNANHVHTVVRDLTNDFGEDALKAHYQKHKH